MMKYRGFGGETGFWDACMESFTLMASLAAVTDRIGLIPTTTVLALHPAYVARMMATRSTQDYGPKAGSIGRGMSARSEQSRRAGRGRHSRISSGPDQRQVEPSSSQS